MKLHALAPVLAVSLLAPSAPSRSAVPAVYASEVAALRSLDDSSLESLRAGVVPAPVALDAGEVSELRAAQAASPELLEMRGGYLTDREWTMIAIGAAVVLLIILL